MNAFTFSFAVLLLASGGFLVYAARLHGAPRGTVEWAATYLLLAVLEGLLTPGFQPFGVHTAPILNTAFIAVVASAALGTAVHHRLPIRRGRIVQAALASVAVVALGVPLLVQSQHYWLYLVVFSAWMLGMAGVFLWRGVRRRVPGYSAVGAGLAAITAFEAAMPFHGDDTMFLMARYAFLELFLLVTALVLVVGSMARLKARLESSERLYRTMFDEHAAPMYLIDQNGEKVVAANRAAQAFYGWDAKAFAGKRLADFCDKGRLVTGTDTAPVIVCRHWLADGSERDVEMRSSPITLPDNRLLHFAIVHDVTDRIAMQRELERMATTDALTGVCNRNRFIHHAEVEFSRARRYRRPLSLLMIDIDHFKRINDSHGHAVGDDALRAFAATAGSSLRANDVLGRLGGEEFAALLPETTLEAALGAGERLRRMVAETPIELPNGDSLQLTTSVGAAELSPDDQDIDALMARADAALYRAKATGRDKVVPARRSEAMISAGNGASR